MPHKIHPEVEHYTGLKPVNARERRSLAKVCLYAVLAIASVFGLREVQQHWQHMREMTWSSATGTIVDARPDPATATGSRYDSAAAFKVQVLVRFSMAGSMQERWIELRKGSESAAEIQLNAQRWKGRIVHRSMEPL